MKRFIIRLDDASGHMKIENWLRMKNLLDRYDIKPIYGIIPDNQDPELLQFNKVSGFWMLMKEWEDDAWIPAMHGYTHVFETDAGGINPVNRKSEFAGLSLEKQREKIKAGYQILLDHDIRPDIFFAPAHTFDLNTLKALYKESPIRIISDTPAWDVYHKNSFYFIPQQSGRVRNLPFKTITFCYHPNTMDDEMFRELEFFMKSYSKLFYNRINLKYRKYDIRDELVKRFYFGRKVLSRLTKDT